MIHPVDGNHINAAVNYNTNTFLLTVTYFGTKHNRYHSILRLIYSSHTVTCIQNFSTTKTIHKHNTLNLQLLKAKMLQNM